MLRYNSEGEFLSCKEKELQIKITEKGKKRRSRSGKCRSRSGKRRSRSEKRRNHPGNVGVD